jgi:alpha-tubulin suppressor-like RCC1 family protein
LIYREHCEAKDFIHEPLRATRDTIFVDSLYASLSADLNDTLERCLRYWIAVRTNGREVGTAYQYTEWRLAPKSSIMTALSHGVRNPTRECDSASVNDTLLFSVKAWNRTRPLRSVVWFDPEKNDTISRRIIPDRLNREIKDTVRYSFDSLGLHRLVAIARDWAGIMRAETVSVKIVPDIPVADAGNDTGVFTGEKVRLHGRADQEFGSIAIWRWKIGEGEWQRTSSSDTVVTAPSTEQKIECLLEAVDEDGNRNGDRMTITTSYRVKAIAAGGFHSLILKEDGSCWTIGYNDHGQLGAGDNVWRASPVKILDSVQLMAAGDLHSLILKTDGTLWACGDNDSGRLGDGTTQWRTSPVKVCENVRSMAAGGKHSIILKTDNTLWTCGDNDSGQLGTGDTLRASRSTPVQVLSDVKAAAAGGRHSVAIKTDGTVWTCGKGRSGQLGTEVDSDKISFVKVMSDMQAVSAGDRHTLFLKNDGTLLTSGNNWYGQLGDNSGGRRLSPEIAMTGVRAVAAGTGFSLALKSDGTLWAFGTDSWGQLGIGAARDTVTMAVQMISDVQSIAAGERHSLILKTDGSLWGCGDNYCGQLGSAKEVRFDRPVMIIPRQ